MQGGGHLGRRHAALARLQSPQRRIAAAQGQQGLVGAALDDAASHLTAEDERQRRLDLRRACPCVLILLFLCP